LTGRLQSIAREYARLAAAGPGNPVWTTAAPPDPFAVSAAPTYADSVQRYATRAYRIRISVLAGEPVDPAFPELLAATVGGGVVRRPPAEELGAAWQNLAALNRDWLDQTYRQGSPEGELGEVERILCDLADESEAATTLRLPFESQGHLPLFTVARRPARRFEPSSSRARRDPGAPDFER
jgi:hypothetical protein